MAKGSSTKTVGYMNSDGVVIRFPKPLGRAEGQRRIAVMADFELAPVLRFLHGEADEIDEAISWRDKDIAEELRAWMGRPLPEKYQQPLI